MFPAWYGLWRFERFYKRVVSDNVLRDKAFNIAKNPKYNRYQRGLSSMDYKFSDRKSRGSGANNEIIQNQQWAEELHNY